MNPFEALVAVVPVVMVFSIPVIAIMTGHQRKMAEIFASQNQGVNPLAVDSLAREVAELKSLVHQQALELDNVSTTLRRMEQRSVSPATDVASRLST